MGHFPNLVRYWFNRAHIDRDECHIVALIMPKTDKTGLFDMKRK